MRRPSLGPQPNPEQPPAFVSSPCSWRRAILFHGEVPTVTSVSSCIEFVWRSCLTNPAGLPTFNSSQRRDKSDTDCWSSRSWPLPCLQCLRGAQATAHMAARYTVVPSSECRSQNECARTTLRMNRPAIEESAWCRGNVTIQRILGFSWIAGLLFSVPSSFADRGFQVCEVAGFTDCRRSLH